MSAPFFEAQGTSWAELYRMVGHRRGMSGGQL